MCGGEKRVSYVCDGMRCASRGFYGDLRMMARHDVAPLPIIVVVALIELDACCRPDSEDLKWLVELDVERESNNRRS